MSMNYEELRERVRYLERVIYEAIDLAGIILDPDRPGEVVSFNGSDTVEGYPDLAKYLEEFERVY